MTTGRQARVRVLAPYVYVIYLLYFTLYYELRRIICALSFFLTMTNGRLFLFVSGVVKKKEAISGASREKSHFVLC